MNDRPREGWWSRNWKWTLPIGCLGLIVMVFAGFAMLFALVIGMMKSSGAYEQAVARAQASSEVCEILGSPVEPGLIVTGNVSTSNSSGHADLTIPISGPNGSGTIRAVATKSAGRWTFTTLEVNVNGGSAPIDLLIEPIP